VDVEALVGAQLAPLANLIGFPVAVCGIKLRLSAAAAQAIGLALHELATNAGKFGALSMDRDRIDVSSFALPTRRMPLGQYQDIHRADPGGRVSPRF
jgi:two-component sensor histidine kinase